MKVTEAGPSLLQAFARIPDPRQSSGRRHPLPAILTLATAAMLCGARSRYAIAQWGRLQEPAGVRALGFTRERTPTVSTLHLVFTTLDVAAVEAALCAWAQAQLGPRDHTIAIDGKALRGSHGEHLPGVDVVAAYADTAGLVLAQTGGEPGAARRRTHRRPRAARRAAASGAAADGRCGILPARAVCAGVRCGWGTTS